MKSLADLADYCDQLPDQIDRAASDLAVQVATAIVNNLTQVTPVDTSNALSNWQVTIGAPAEFERPPFVPGFRGSTYLISMQAAQAAAASVLKTKEPGEPIQITNVVPYIEDLNDGTSKQEPAGFVERAVLIGEVISRNGIKL